ncbi:MAG: hypothetical protein HY978_00510 [Candidatus Liptonbacteria bacterium]|nr:hypothetical protein [Candidatus Liptonbacteria bacterium]
MPEYLNLNQSPQGKEEARKNAQESRRNFFRRAAGGAVGAAAILGAGAALLKEGVETKNPGKEERKQKAAEDEELPPREVIEDSREYKSGDSIHTPAGTVEIQGWKVAMGDLAVTGMSYFAMSGGKNYSLRFRSPEDGKIWMVYTSETRKEVDFPAHNTQDVQGRYEHQKVFYLLPNLRAPHIVLEVLEFPSERAGLEQEIFAGSKEKLRKIRRTHRRQASKMHRYKIRLLGVTNTLKGPEKIPRVFAEGKIAEAELDKIADIHRLAGAFRPVAPVYVYGEEGDPYWQVAEPSSHYDPLYNRVALQHQEFAYPDVPGQAVQVACHEIFHSVMRGTKLEGVQDQAYKKVQEEFSRIAKRADLNREKSWDDPVFITFREFSYYRKKASKTVLPAGHPWDNARELFASAVVVMRYYPDEFVRKLRTLSPEEQSLVRGAGRAVLDLLHAMNSDEKVLRRLLPKLDHVREALRN